MDKNNAEIKLYERIFLYVLSKMYKIEIEALKIMYVYIKRKKYERGIIEIIKKYK